MPGIPIRKVERWDIPQLSKVLALAFEKDPVMSWAIRTDNKRLDALTDLYNYSIEGGFSYGEETTTEDLRACAVWLPPEAMQEKLPPLHMLRMLPHYIQWTGIARLGRLLKLFEIFEEKRPEKPHYYLDFIGVKPEVQGRGYASALLGYTLDRLDNEGIPAYLESSNVRNNPLYERHGFRITEEVRIPGGPTLWCMWREPKKSQ